MHYPSMSRKNYTPEDLKRASEVSRRLIDLVCDSASDEREIAHWMQAMLAVTGIFATHHPAALDVAADMVTVASHILQSTLPAIADKAQTSTATHAPAPDSSTLH